jgi:hypothetical protein
MNIRDKIAELTTEIKELEDKASEIATEATSLRAVREKLIIKVLVEDKIFEDTSWDVGSYMSGVKINYIKSYGATVYDVFEPIQEIFSKDGDIWMEINDGISLRLEGGEVSLSFKEAKQVMPFIKKHKMKLTGSSIVDRLAKMKRDAAALESIVHTFNLWNKKP